MACNAVLVDVDRAVFGRDDVVPGLVVGIQPHGELANWHPHLHVLATDGTFAPDGTFIPMPDTPAELYLMLWEKKQFLSASLRRAPRRDTSLTSLIEMAIIVL